MYMQIIQGKIKDRAAARVTLDRWYTDLQPGATGWLGGTYGVTDDDMLVACVRFTSAESAEANNHRPEQGEWWKEMEQHFDGPVTFHDCSDVTLLLAGGSDDARFVQVIQGKVGDRNRMHELLEQTGSLVSTHRPDVLGATIAIDADGYFTETVAFTSEAEARANETKAMPDDVRKVMDEEMALLQDVRYLDLHEPWFATASKLS